MAISLTATCPLEARSCVQKHFLRSGALTELYLTAFAPDGMSLPEQAGRIYEELAAELKAHGAFIFEERIFASPESAAALRDARSHELGVLDDGVLPTWLMSANGDPRICGVQIHAVAGCGMPDTLALDGIQLGRVFSSRGAKRVMLSGVGGDILDNPQTQYLVAFEKSQRLLSQVGMDFCSVARTWWWMRDILEHYDVFNRVRRAFFARFKCNPDSSIESGAASKVFTSPASTGIGVWPLSGGFSALDVMAADGENVRTQYFQGAGNQRAAAEYGSAFARASTVDCAGLRTIYVSGTADIDKAGITCNIGNAKAQIAGTMENVAAVLKDLGASMDDIVHACAYSKTPEIEQLWKATPISRRVPAVSIVADVCRDNLLFELEATALVRTPVC